VAELQYTYLGQKQEGEKQVALIELNGVLRNAPGVAAGMRGKLAGTATLEVASGTLLSGQATLEVELDLAGPDGKGQQAWGRVAVQLRRR
jgi:hypothetical protein